MTKETRQKISQSLKGKSKSQIHKKKLSEVKSGVNNPMFGRKQSTETRRKIANSRIGKKRKEFSKTWRDNLSASLLGIERTEEYKAKFRGENNPNWKGGITKIRRPRETEEYKQWRRFVLQRDNFTCQKCLDRPCAGHPVKLHVHHIKKYADYPESRLAVDNGQTLCVPCHKNTNNYCGRKQ